MKYLVFPSIKIVTDLICNKLILWIFLLYFSIVLIAIKMIKMEHSIHLILFFKICLPIIFVIPAVKITLSKNKMEKIHIILSNNKLTYRNFFVFLHIVVTLSIALFLSLPFISGDYFIILQHPCSNQKICFEIIKYVNLILFFVLIAFKIKFNNRNYLCKNFSNDEDMSPAIAPVLILINLILTFGLYIFDLLINDYIFHKYFGGYFGSHIIAKLSLSGLYSYTPQIDNINNGIPVFRIPDDVSITLILSFFSLIILMSLFYNNKKYVENCSKNSIEQ